MVHVTAFLFAPSSSLHSFSSCLSSSHSLRPRLTSSQSFHYAHAAPKRLYLVPTMTSGSSAKKSDSSSSNPNPYRTLGLPEDASYDDIERAFEQLKIKYADDETRRIQVELAKEKILDERLKLRMSGKLKAAVKDSPFERKVRKKELIERMPPFIQKYWKKPDAEWLKRITTWMFCAFIICLWNPEIAASGVAVGLLTGAAFLYNRGRPKQSRFDYDDRGAGRGGPGDAAKTRTAVAATIGLLLAGGTLGLVFGQLFCLILPFLLNFIAGESIMCFFTVLGFWSAAACFQVNDWK